MIDNPAAGEKRAQDGTGDEYEGDEEVGFDDVAEIIKKAARSAVHEAVNKVARSAVNKTVKKVASNTVHKIVNKAAIDAVNKVALNSMHDQQQRPCTSTRARKKHDVSRAFVQGS